MPLIAQHGRRGVYTKTRSMQTVSSVMLDVRRVSYHLNISQGQYHLPEVLVSNLGLFCGNGQSVSDTDPSPACCHTINTFHGKCETAF